MEDQARSPETDTAELRSHLADRDVPCPGCGYNLRGLGTDRCPECNQHLELRVSLTEPRLGAYLAAVTGLLGGGALAVLFFGIVVVISMIENDWPRGRLFFPIVVLPLIAGGVLLGLAILMLTPRKRRWFRTLDRMSRGWVIAGCGGLSVAFVAWFLATVFRR
ncbi:MAG: hypothetical protein ACK4WH_13525 [Phycisphaerales bacterium]